MILFSNNQLSTTNMGKNPTDGAWAKVYGGEQKSLHWLNAQEAWAAVSYQLCAPPKY